MPALSKHISPDAVIIKRRFDDDHFYAINSHTYNSIIETVAYYRESMYLLPDFEQVEATGADAENDSELFTIKVNEIMFV